MQKVYEAIPSTCNTINLTEIIPGVELVILSNKEAVLTINDNPIEFEWNNDAAEIFANLEDACPVELLAVLARCEMHVIQKNN
ncbi:hypothetical protein ACQKMD_16645 [Viridibacillus sp. NPDC096237]|uniref:hypothetical protein n=1 Tax=Viridibacillus sp. NPDC096237 TaxID=3390721 RepID=UPI003D076262